MNLIGQCGRSEILLRICQPGIFAAQETDLKKMGLIKKRLSRQPVLFWRNFQKLSRRSRRFWRKRFIKISAIKIRFILKNGPLSSRLRRASQKLIKNYCRKWRKSEKFVRLALKRGRKRG